jgi:hypothetical protein
MLLWGEVGEDALADIAVSCEHHWGMKMWREAIKAAAKLKEVGVTRAHYMPRRAACRPRFRYYRLPETGEEFAALESSLREDGTPFYMGLAVEVEERSFTNDQLAAMERDCCEAEIKRSGL